MTLIQEIEVVDALAELGVPLEVLRDALLEGEAHRDACTRFDPQNAPGFIAYARTTRKLRELLVPLGWTARDEANLALVVSPSGTMGLAVSTGDEGTGIPGRFVKSKYPKGPATHAAVERNQLLLFPELQHLTETHDEVDRETWLLMRRRLGSRVFSELSLPQAVGEDGRVDEWARRIILPSMELELVAATQPDLGEEIVIDVARRS